MVDIVCYYADLGRPYLPLLKRMTESAKDVMPDARLVLLTPTPKDELSALFDGMVSLPSKTNFANLCLERVRAMVSWMLVAENPAIFVDPDLEFHRPVEFGNYDVGLMWRPQRPDQPINTGMILAEPHQNEFWRHYGQVAVNLPPQVHWWWCDQLAFALLTGVMHQPEDEMRIDGARVRLLDGAKLCPASNKESKEAWAIHYKGSLKGPEWESIYPGRSRKSGDGKSSVELR